MTATSMSGIDMTSVSEGRQIRPLDVSWKHLFAFTKLRHAGYLVAAVVSSTLFATIKTILSIVLGQIFNIVADFGSGHGSKVDTLAEISKWSLILLGLSIANWLASAIFMLLWIVFGELQANAARQDILASLFSKEMSWFDSLEQGISSLLVRIQTQIRELQLAASQILGLLISDAISSAASISVAFYYSWKLTLVLLATLPISVLCMSLATRRLEPAIQAQKRDLQAASKYATSSIKAIEIVKVFNGFDRELWQYYQTVQLAGKHYLVQAQCNAIQMGYVGFWVIGMFVIGFWYGIVLVDDGLPPGHVFTTFYATLSAFQGIEGLLPHWLVLSKGMSAGAFLLAISSTTKDDTSTTKRSSITPKHCQGNLELTNVSFAYPSNPTKKVLNPSSFFFPATKMTFIVGRSGSGKSTVGNLIAQFYEPMTGTISLDGYPLDILDKDWVRSNITLIQQLSVVFDDSIFNNIAVALGDPQIVSQGSVASACEFSLLQSTLSSLPIGVETRIGSTGRKLSGGQMQRLALARARLKDPSVLILDEVTSSLDQISRALVMDAIREWRRDKTTIIITHDISQIDEDDFVYVMEDATLVQQGLRRDLEGTSNGVFSMMASQARIELTPSPIDINVISPSSPSDSNLTATYELPSRTSFVSQVIMNELEGNSNSAKHNHLSQQMTLGAGTAIAWQMRKEQIWESPDPNNLQRPAEDHQQVELEKRRLASFIDKSFSPSPKRCASQRGYLPPLVISFGRDDSEYVMDDANFVFGKAERRNNISALRMLQTSKPLPALPEGAIPGNDRKQDSLLSTLRTVWPALTAREKAIFILGVLACFISAATTPMFSFCLAKLLGVMWSTGNRSVEGRQWAIYLVIIAVVEGLSTGGGHYMLEKVGQSWVNKLRLEALKRILRQPKSWFDKEKNSGSRINECLDRNSEETRNIVGRFIPIITTVTGMISISVIWALATSWKLTLVALTPLPVIIGAVKGYTIVSGRWESKCNESAEDAGTILNEIFVNIRTVRALHIEKYFGNKYQKLVSHTLSMGKKRAGYTCGLFGLYQSMSYPLTALVFYYATVLLTKDDGVTATQVLQVVNLLVFSIGTSTDALGRMPQLIMAQATATRLLNYAKMPLDPQGEGQTGVKVMSPLPVLIKDLQFSYSRHAESQVLRGVTFDIRKGTCTGIVGSSGCGKSTLISLLMGLYQPSIHTTHLDFGGVPFSEIDIQHLRSTMAYVSQTPYLFPMSIAENILYGLPEDSQYRNTISVYSAAQAAGIHEYIISLSEGYATVVGDGGITLSGGQAQRLSIARALVRQPRLLILDEPTSALDAESSNKVRETISDLIQQAKVETRDMAIVIVTHTKEMMQICDHIVMMDGGVIVEEGGYNELLKEGGMFKHLVSGGEWPGV